MLFIYKQKLTHLYTDFFLLLFCGDPPMDYLSVKNGTPLIEIPFFSYVECLREEETLEEKEKKKQDSNVE